MSVSDLQCEASGITLNIIWQEAMRQRTLLINGMLLTTKRNANGVRSTQEILSKRRDLTTVTDGNRAIVSVGIIVYRLLVVLELKGL